MSNQLVMCKKILRKFEPEFRAIAKKIQASGEKMVFLSHYLFGFIQKLRNASILDSPLPRVPVGARAD